MKKLKKHVAAIGLLSGFASFLSGLASFAGIDIAAIVGGVATMAGCYYLDIERLFDAESTE